MRSRRLLRRVLIAGVAVAACCMCLWPMAWFFEHLLPPTESMEVARRHAQAEGLPVPDAGGFQQYVTEPDALGGCEVEVLLWLPPEGDRKREYAARVRRWSMLTGWRVVEAGPRDVPERPPPPEQRHAEPGAAADPSRKAGSGR